MSQCLTGLKGFGTLFTAGAGVIVYCLFRAGCGGLEVCFARILLIEVMRMTKCGFYDISADGAGLRCCFGRFRAGGVRASRAGRFLAGRKIDVPMVVFIGRPFIGNVVGDHRHFGEQRRPSVRRVKRVGTQIAVICVFKLNGICAGARQLLRHLFAEEIPFFDRQGDVVGAVELPQIVSVGGIDERHGNRRDPLFLAEIISHVVVGAEVRVGRRALAHDRMLAAADRELRGGSLRRDAAVGVEHVDVGDVGRLSDRDELVKSDRRADIEDELSVFVSRLDLAVFESRAEEGAALVVLFAVGVENDDLLSFFKNKVVSVVLDRQLQDRFVVLVEDAVAGRRRNGQLFCRRAIERGRHARIERVGVKNDVQRDVSLRDIGQSRECAGVDLFEHHAGLHAEVAAVFDHRILRRNDDRVDLIVEASEILALFQNADTADDQNAVLNVPQRTFGLEVPVRLIAAVDIGAYVSVGQFGGDVRASGVGDIGI